MQNDLKVLEGKSQKQNKQTNKKQTNQNLNTKGPKLYL
jgi:hypothetical protein